MSTTVKLSDVSMPGMFATKPDDEGPRWEHGDAYVPMPYALGEICVPCWLRPRDTCPEGGCEWVCFDDTLCAVGHDGCPHGGGAS